MPRSQAQRFTTPLSIQAGFLFVLLWFSCLVLYPHWYAQVLYTHADPFYSLALVWLSILAGLLLVGWLFRGEEEPLLKEPAFLYPALAKLWPVLGFCFLAHLSFLSAPIVTGLDAQEHAGVPAVLVALARSHLPVPLPIVAWLLFLVFWIGLRRFMRTPPRLRTLLGWVALLFLVGVMEATALRRVEGIERFGDPRFITRYPALGRFLYIGMYALFGIHEWVGRMGQILLSGVAAIYLYRLGVLFFKETAGIVAALLLLFLPPMFHYGDLNMLDCGTVTFAVVSEYYLLRYFEESRRRDFCRALLLLSAGILYKRVLFFMAPIAVAQWGVYSLVIRRQFRFREAIGFALPAGTFVLYQWLARSNEDVPSAIRLGHWVDPDYLLAPIQELPTAFTWPILFLVLLGIFLALRRRVASRRWVLYALVWYGIYLLCYVLWKRPGNIRQALPSYPPLVLLAAIAFEYLLTDATRLYRRLLWGALAVYLAWVVLLLPRPAPASDARPIKDHTWVNLTNRTAFYLPYSDMFRRIRKRVPAGDVIYAPMANEPSRYYLAAYGLEDRLTWLGDPWTTRADQTLESLRQYCQSHKVSYVLLPNRRWGQTALSRRLLDRIANSEAKYLSLLERSSMGTEYLLLYVVDQKVHAQRVR